MNYKRPAFLSLLIVSSVLLQTAGLSRVRLFGVAPDLLLAIVICIALLDGPSAGATAGFAAGLLTDLLLQSPKGITSLGYLTVGYVVGSIRPYMTSTSVLIPAATILAGSLVGGGLNQGIHALLGRELLPFTNIIAIIGLTAVYNALLTPFVFPIVGRITRIYKAERVIVW